MGEPGRANCEALISSTTGMLEWERDGRFGCAVAAFPADAAARVLTAVQEAASFQWTPDNIESADARVAEVAGRMGLRTGQLLFTSDPGSAVMLYVAWWPWAGGQKISVRVGALGASEAELAQWFGL